MVICMVRQLNPWYSYTTNCTGYKKLNFEAYKAASLLLPIWSSPHKPLVNETFWVCILPFVNTSYELIVTALCPYLSVFQYSYIHVNPARLTWPYRFTAKF